MFPPPEQRDEHRRAGTEKCNDLNFHPVTAGCLGGFASHRVTRQFKLAPGGMRLSVVGLHIRKLTVPGVT